MNIKSYIKTHVASILLTLAIPSILIGIIFSLLFNPTQTEKVQFFIPSASVNKTIFENLKDSLDVKDIYVTYISETDTYYDTSFVTNGLITSDILFIKESSIDETSYQQYLTLSDELLEYMNIDPSSYDFLEYEGEKKGIIVYSRQDSINIFPNIIFESNDRYIMVLNAASPNIYMNPGRRQTSNALLAIKLLLSN